MYWSKGELKSRNFDTTLGRFWHYLNPFLFGLIYFVFVGILTGGGLNSTTRLAFMVFNLYVLDGYSHKEIAEMLEITTGTTKSNLARARMLLKNKVEQYKASLNSQSL